MLVLAVLWQRLNFLPLRHQQGSLALRPPWLLVVTVMPLRLSAHPTGPMGRGGGPSWPRPCEHDEVTQPQALEPLETLPAVAVEGVELVTVTVPLVRPLRTAAGTRSARDVLLVRSEEHTSELQSLMRISSAV